MSTKTALIICDLEGVAGADALSALVANHPAWELARQQLTRELNAAIRGLSKQGFTRFRISDTHHNGSTALNVIEAELAEGAELYKPDDPYHPQLFDGAEAVVCVGMHAAGGLPGFVPHAVEPHVAFRMGDAPISEAELVLHLAAEAGVPFGFVSGDELLARALTRLGVRTVVTKRVLSPTTAKSEPGANVEKAIERAAAVPARLMVRPPIRALELHLKSPGFVMPTSPPSGVERTGSHTIRVDGPSTRVVYSRANAVLGAIRDATAPWLRSTSTSPEYLQEFGALIEAPWPSLGPATLAAPKKKMTKPATKPTKSAKAAKKKPAPTRRAKRH